MTGVREHDGKNVVERWDQIFKALSAEPRRQIVVSLRDVSAGEPVSLPDAAVNPNVPVDIDELRQALYHQHLPLLAEIDVIEWETDPLVAYRGPRFEEAAIVFDSLYASAADIPDSLVVGCQRLEEERHRRRTD